MKNSILDYLFLYFVFAIYSVITVCAKLASQQTEFYMTLAFFAAEFLLLFVYAILWQQVLKRFSLIVAISNKGITVILNLFWSALLFKESIVWTNVLGAALIIFGIGLVSSDA